MSLNSSGVLCSRQKKGSLHSFPKACLKWAKQNWSGIKNVSRITLQNRCGQINLNLFIYIHDAPREGRGKRRPHKFTMKTEIWEDVRAVHGLRAATDKRNDQIMKGTRRVWQRCVWMFSFRSSKQANQIRHDHDGLRIFPWESRQT